MRVHLSCACVSCKCLHGGACLTVCNQPPLHTLRVCMVCVCLHVSACMCLYGVSLTSWGKKTQRDTASPVSPGTLRGGPSNVGTRAILPGKKYLTRKPYTLNLGTRDSARQDQPHTLHPTPYTLNFGARAILPARSVIPTPYTLHPTPYPLHPTPYTLHTTPHTLHPTP